MRAVEIMPDVRLVRRYRFSAAHRLDSPALSPERNREVYGKCNNPFGHGHDYVLEVAVRGAVDPRLGRILPVHALDSLVERVILRAMNHRNLNAEIDEFMTLVPTTENVAAVIARRLAQAWPISFPFSPARFEKVRIWETPNNIFEEAAPDLSGTQSSSDLASMSAAGK